MFIVALLLAAASPDGLDLSDESIKRSAVALCPAGHLAPCELRHMEARDRIMLAWGSSETTDADRKLMIDQINNFKSGDFVDWHSVAQSYFAKRTVAMWADGRIPKPAVRSYDSPRRTHRTSCSTWISKKRRHIRTNCSSY